MKEKVENQYKKWAEIHEEDKVKLIEKYGTSYEEFMNSFLALCFTEMGQVLSITLITELFL